MEGNVSPYKNIDKTIKLMVMLTGKKNAQCKSCELSFIQCLTEDHIPGDSLSRCSEELFRKDAGEASIYVILAKEYIKSNLHLGRKLVLVMRNRYLS